MAFVPVSVIPVSGVGERAALAPPERFCTPLATPLATSLAAALATPLAHPRTIKILYSTG